MNRIYSISLQDWANVATLVGVVGVLIAAVALFFTARQLSQNTKISRGQFWLELEKLFSKHDKVHVKLRPGGEWTKDDCGPETPDQWVEVEDYMGLFEHCEVMLRKGLIDLETFRDIFSYRLKNVVANKVIVNAKLRQEMESWKRFSRLLEKLKIEIPE